MDLEGRVIAVTGAAGFIGSHVVACLAQRGATVVAVDPGPGWRTHFHQTLSRANVTLVPTDQPWPSASFHSAISDEIDSVVHLAYAEPRSSNDLQVAHDEYLHNVLGTIALLESLPSSVHTMVFASSALVYGAGGGSAFFESGPTAPVNDYSMGKLAIERVLTDWVDRSRTAVALRLSTVYGPGETVARAIPNFIRRSLAGQACQVGIGGDMRDYVAVQDVAAAVACAVGNRNPSAPFLVANVGTGIGTRTDDLAELTKAAVGSTVPVEVGTGGRDPIEIVCNPDRAAAELGFRAEISLSAGIQDEINWFRQHPELWQKESAAS